MPRFLLDAQTRKRRALDDAETQIRRADGDRWRLRASPLQRIVFGVAELVRRAPNEGGTIAALVYALETVTDALRDAIDDPRAS